MSEIKMKCVFCVLWALSSVFQQTFGPTPCSTFLRLSDRRLKPVECRCSNSSNLWHTAESIRRPRLQIRKSKLGDFAWSPNKDSGTTPAVLEDSATTAFWPFPSHQIQKLVLGRYGIKIFNEEMLFKYFTVRTRQSRKFSSESPNLAKAQLVPMK